MNGPLVAVAGLSHLGICSVAGAAARGCRVVAYDPDPSLVARLAAGEPPIREPDLPETLAAHAAAIRWTSARDDLAAAELAVIAAEVPTDEDGQSDLAPLGRLIQTVEPTLPEATPLALLSQAPPGFTRMLARIGDLRPGRPLFRQIETVVVGEAVRRAVAPERIVVGCADPDAPLPDAYRRYLEAFGCPVLTMRYESAEIARIAVNCMLAAQISVANTLSGLCERIGGAWSEIAPALRLDQRIGPHAYVTPGLGLSGGAIERDLATVIRLGDANGSEVGLARAIIANSRHRRDWALRNLQQRLLGRERKAAIGVLGLAYKPGTSSTKNAAGVALIESLHPWPIRVHDPAAIADPAWHPSLTQVDDPLDAAAGVHALCIMTPWPDYRDLRPASIATRMRGRLVLDPHDVLDAAACAAAGLQRVVLGAPC